MSPASAALQGGHLVRDGQVGAELLGLVVGAGHQGHARDAGGEAQIVLDPRRGPGLSAERPGVQHQHRQAFRGGVDGGGQAGGTSADHGHVVDVVRIQVADHADAARQLGVGWMAQDLAAGAEHDRQLGLVDREPLDQHLGAVDGVGIQMPVGMAVAGQEARQADDLAVGGPADDHRPSAQLQKADPAQDQGPHDPLAQLGLGDQHRAQAVGPDAQHLNVGDGLDVDQGGAVRQLGQFADEVAGLVLDDHVAFVVSVAPADAGAAFEDDHQPGRNLAGLGQHVAGLGVGDLAEAADAVDFLRLEAGEHLIAAGVDDGHDPRVRQDRRLVIYIRIGFERSCRNARRALLEAGAGRR